VCALISRNKLSFLCKKKNTIVTACENVAGFSAFYNRFEQKISLAGRSKETFNNYAHHLAKAALHFNQLPTEIDAEKINEYLYHLQRNFDPSASFFKFAVYSLRFAYRMDGTPEKYITLPSIKKEKKLPVVLSRDEVKRLLAAPQSLKHRVLMALIYSCGLRCLEVRNVMLRDIDLDRKMLHVRNGKGRKDRYVPLSDILIGWLRDYMASENPSVWLFNGRPKHYLNNALDSHYSPKGVGWVIRQSAKSAGIIKKVSTHTLRHTYATHLLEDGLDIVSIRDLLGHSSIETTMVYLHVAHYDRVRSFSPLDTVYGLRKHQPFVLRDGSGNSVCALAAHLRECEDCRRVGVENSGG
jgi:integrase/recombinase XerD